MLIAGIILIVIAIVFGVIHVISRRRAGKLLTAKPAKIAELGQSAGQIAGELGGGGFEEMAELHGELRCQPLISPLGERPCVWYRMTVSRKYEEHYEERDSQGNVRRGTRTGTESMSTQSEGIDFEFDDGTGRLPVHAEGLDHDAQIETVDRFEPEGGMMLTLGRFSMSVPMLGHGRRTLGYQYEEKIVPADGRFTLIGRVSDRSGRLAVDREGPIFILSRKTRAELLGKAKTTAAWTAAASGICLVFGVGLLIAGLIVGTH